MKQLMNNRQSRSIQAQLGWYICSGLMECWDIGELYISGIVTTMEMQTDGWILVLRRDFLWCLDSLLTPRLRGVLYFDDLRMVW